MAKMGPGKRQTYEKPQNTKKTVFQLLHYVGRYKLSMVLVIVFLLVNTACTVGGSYLIKPLINDYILPGDFQGLAKMLCLMGAVYVTGALCSFGYARIMVHVAQNTVSDWEQCKSYPSIDKIYDIANFLKIPVSKLISDVQKNGCKADCTQKTNFF